jgi:hypothetical protein
MLGSRLRMNMITDMLASLSLNYVYGIRKACRITRRGVDDPHSLEPNACHQTSFSYRKYLKTKKKREEKP